MYQLRKEIEMKRVICILIALVFCLSLSASPLFAGGKKKAATKKKTKNIKVMICHIPPGNPSNAQTIRVGSAAVKAHLAHGDYLGPCNNHGGGSI